MIYSLISVFFGTEPVTKSKVVNSMQKSSKMEGDPAFRRFFKHNAGKQCKKTQLTQAGVFNRMKTRLYVTTSSPETELILNWDII